ncbi:hypothetical protein JTE90_001823, partial [Oedothorax gibbosus]
VCNLLSPTCPPPDVPEGGWYTPVLSRYLPGDKVVLLVPYGSDQNGEGKQVVPHHREMVWCPPFCDKSTRVKMPPLHQTRVTLKSFLTDDQRHAFTRETPRAKTDSLSRSSCDRVQN